MGEICLDNIMTYIGILSFVGLLVQFMVVSPIKGSLAAINKSIEGLQVDIKELTLAMNEHRERLALVEQMADNLHTWVERYENSKAK